MTIRIQLRTRDNYRFRVRKACQTLWGLSRYRLMAFEKLINKPMHEEHLLTEVTRIIQDNYENLQEQYFFMRLCKCSEGTSEIIWIKSFTDKYDFSDFFLDSKFNRACMLVKFEDCHYVLCAMAFIWVIKSKFLKIRQRRGDP